MEGCLRGVGGQGGVVRAAAERTRARTLVAFGGHREPHTLRLSSICGEAALRYALYAALAPILAADDSLQPGQARCWTAPPHADVGVAYPTAVWAGAGPVPRLPATWCGATVNAPAAQPAPTPKPTSHTM